MFDQRLVFDTIPELFDKWRVKYSQELFDYIVKECGLNSKKRCLEIGPGQVRRQILHWRQDAIIVPSN